MSSKTIIPSASTKFAKNSFLYFLSMIIPKAVGFLILPIYTRFLTPEDYGLFSYTTSVIGIMTVFSALGLNAFYLRNYSIEDDKKLFNGTLFWFMCIWNVCLLGIALLTMPTILKILKAPFDFYPYMFLALVTQFFNSMEIIPMRTYRIRGEVHFYFYRILVKTVLSVLLGLLFIVVLRMGVLGRYYAELLNAGIFSLVFIVYIGRNSTFTIDKDILKRGLKFSLPIIPSDILIMANPMIVGIIIQKLLSLGQLGIYSIALTLSSVVSLVTQSIFLSIEPTLYTKFRDPDFSEYFKKIKNNLLPITSIFCVGAGLFVREASMLLLAERYWHAWPIVQVISISYIISVLNSLFSNIILIQGKTKILMWANLGSIVVAVIILLVLLPIAGTNGLGWSSIGGVSTTLVILYLVSNKKNFKNLHLIKDFLMIGLAVVVLFVSRFTHTYTIVMTIIMKICIFLVFALIEIKVYNIQVTRAVQLLRRRQA